MTQCIIFDLSEVLIAGLVGIERVLCRELLRPEAEILSCFGGIWLNELLIGNISEDIYLGPHHHERKMEDQHHKVEDGDKKQLSQ